MTIAIRFLCIVGAIISVGGPAFGQTVDSDSISQMLTTHQLDLATEGKELLLKEASRATFFLIGGLHGDQETQLLVQAMVDGSEQFGYHDVAVEMSPWAAGRLEASRESPGPGIRGCDIEEVRPDLLVREVAAINPQNSALDSMVNITRDGYKRASAPHLLQLTRQVGEFKDALAGGISLYTQLLRTLDVESARVDRNARLKASTRREQFMKELFLAHFHSTGQIQAKPRFLVVFGQNHLGRGIDRRGVSTLGNFIAELAVAEGVQSFHVILYAAGGKISFRGLQDIDQRKDDMAFDFLASLAQFPATVFDLRPIRQPLHNASAHLSPRDASLLYWADSYDLIICYRTVTPLRSVRRY